MPQVRIGILSLRVRAGARSARFSGLWVILDGPVATLVASPEVASGAHENAVGMSHECREARHGYGGVCRDGWRGERQGAVARTGIAVLVLTEFLRKRNWARESGPWNEDINR